MKTKIKVLRAELLKVVDGRARKAMAEYKRAVSDHPAAVAAWQAECIEKLESALAMAKKGRFVDHVSFSTRPQKPTAGRALCNLQRMLKTLKIGADETILLSQDDADDYFGPCSV